MASLRADCMPAAPPEPATAQQASEDRPAVRATGLAKSYGPTVALAGLDLHVAAGETVALLGPNGAGKTTTIGLLLGLLTPSRGQGPDRPAERDRRGPVPDASPPERGRRPVPGAVRLQPAAI